MLEHVPRGVDEANPVGRLQSASVHAAQLVQPAVRLQQWGVLATRSVAAKRTRSTQLADATPLFRKSPQLT